MSGYRKDGDKWKCPKCARTYTHVCDEAEGCSWEADDPTRTIKVSHSP